MYKREVLRTIRLSQPPRIVKMRVVAPIGVVALIGVMAPGCVRKKNEIDIIQFDFLTPIGVIAPWVR